MDIHHVGELRGLADLVDKDLELFRHLHGPVLRVVVQALGKPLAGGTVTFDDSGSVAGWALTAVGEMQQNGVMGGTGNNVFCSRMSYTREQSVVTIMRLYEQMK